MAKIRIKSGNTQLPEDFLKRRNLPEDLECWMDAYDGSLVLHPRLPDVRKLYIEPTTCCNLHCRTCIRNVWDDPVQHMSYATFEKIVASLADLPNLERVVFTSFGEPLTNPRLLDMIARVREFDLKVTLGTNGLLLNQKVAEKLVRLGVDRVMVSIDGGKPETFAGVRGAMLSKVIDGIRGLNEAKQRLHSLFPSIGVEFVALRSNVSELDDLVRLSSDLNISRLLVSHVLPYTKELHEEAIYSYEPKPPFKASSWPARLDAWVTWATAEMPRMHWGAERYCRFVQDHAMVVAWDGGVSPCYALSHSYRYFTIDGIEKQVTRYVFDNVNRVPLVDIWTSEEYVLYRSAVKAYRFPSCPDCDLRETCDLRKENNGCWGWNPSCADCLWSQNIVRCP